MNRRFLLLALALPLSAQALTPPPPVKPGEAPNPPITAPMPGTAVVTTTTTVDRTKAPEVIPPVALQMPEPVEHKIGDATVQLVTIKGLRKLEVHVIYDRGAFDLDGIASPATSALGSLQSEATLTHDAEALADIEQRYDISLGSWMGQTSSGVDLSVPLEEMTRGMDLLREVIREPAFPKAEVKRYIREQIIYYNSDAPSSARAVANAGVSYAWFPADHPYGTRPDLAATKKIKSKALLERYAKIQAEAPVTVVVVGDVTWEDIQPSLTAAIEGLGRPGKVNEDPAFAAPTATRIIAVDMPGAEQATIRMRMAGPVDADAAKIPGSVANFIIGGSFLSRLNSNLREEKGWTYGAGSAYGADDTVGTFTVRVDVKVENCAGTLSEIAKELDKVVAEGFTATELSGARNTMVGGWNTVLETSGGAAGFYDGNHFDQRTAAEALAETQQLDKVTTADAQAVAAKWWGKDAPRLWVIVGDRATLEPQLQAAGWTAEWMTAEQVVLGQF